MVIHRIKQHLKFKQQTFLAGLRKKLLGPHGFAMICETANGLFAVDPEDLGVGQELLKSGEYGRAELDLLEKFLTPHSKVLIVGSHIGSLAIPIAKKVKEIYAIEANPNTLRLLAPNLALNNISNAR